MKSLKSIIKQLNNSLSINYKRKKYLIKNKEIISKYKAMSDEELFIEYVNKKAKYQFHKNFFIGLVLTIFVTISLVYMFKLKNFSDILLKERLEGSSNLELFIKNTTGVITYFRIGLIIIIVSIFIIWRMIKKFKEVVENLSDLINYSTLLFIIILTIKLITIHIIQIIFTMVVLVYGSCLLSSK